MGDRIFNMSQGSTYIENQTNYIRGNQVFSDPKFMSHNPERPEVKAPQTQMELLVTKHPNPVAFIAQLKRDVAACDKPKEKMRIVNKAIEAGFLPEDLPYQTFCEEIDSISQPSFSRWLNVTNED